MVVQSDGGVAHYRTNINAEMFQRFEICSRANRWDRATKAVKYPTLLKGEALTTWTDLSAEEKDNHDLKKLLLQAMPDLDTTTRDQWLLHQFVAGLP